MLSIALKTSDVTHGLFWCEEFTVQEFVKGLNLKRKKNVY